MSNIFLLLIVPLAQQTGSYLDMSIYRVYDIPLEHRDEIRKTIPTNPVCVFTSLTIGDSNIPGILYVVVLELLRINLRIIAVHELAPAKIAMIMIPPTVLLPT